MNYSIYVFIVRLIEINFYIRVFEFCMGYKFYRFGRGFFVYLDNLVSCVVVERRMCKEVLFNGYNLFYYLVLF